MDCRLESYIVDPERPPFEDDAVTSEPTERPSPRPNDNMSEVRWRQRTNKDGSRSPSNIFTREVNNVPRGRGLFGLNNAPSRRGLLRLNSAL